MLYNQEPLESERSAKRGAPTPMRLARARSTARELRSIAWPRARADPAEGGQDRTQDTDRPAGETRHVRPRRVPCPGKLVCPARRRRGDDGAVTCGGRVRVTSRRISASTTMCPGRRNACTCCCCCCLIMRVHGPVAVTDSRVGSTVHVPPVGRATPTTTWVRPRPVHELTVTRMVRRCMHEPNKQTAARSHDRVTCCSVL